MKIEMKKGPWSRDEDQKLLAYIQQHGHGSWRTLPQKAGLERCGKSCRLRWTNYLRPDIKRGKFSPHEEKSIIRLHALLGNRWSVIAAHLPKRTDNEIKNYWNTRLKKRLTRMGIDPTTHKPKNNPAQSAALSHLAQWETTRLEAEARLAGHSKLVFNLHVSPPPPPLTLPPPPCLDVLKVWESTRCFFLESPTSTLNFSSSDSLTVPAVEPVNSDVKGETENSLQLQNINNNNPVGYDYEMMMGSMDHTSFNQDYNMSGPVFGEYEDNKANYWNDLLDLAMDSSTLYGSLATNFN